LAQVELRQQEACSLSAEPQTIACDDRGQYYHVQVTGAVATALFELRIFRGMSMPPGQEAAPLVFPKNARIEPYTAYLMRGPLATLGAFSFAHTVLPWDLVVGRYCSIAAGLGMFGEQHPTDRATTSAWSYSPQNPVVSLLLDDLGITDFQTYAARQKPPAAIGNDVWIGSNVTLARGITIGDGAIVGAGAVVTRSVEPFCIVGGNPARLIRRRFPDALCDRYLRTQWWNYALAGIRRPAFLNPEQFIVQIEDLAASGRLRPYRPAVLDAPALLGVLEKLREGTWTPPARPTRDVLLGEGSDEAGDVVR
jgi:acetyltransferase-like isoleucine patch superfamily enzyme